MPDAVAFSPALGRLIADMARRTRLPALPLRRRIPTPRRRLTARITASDTTTPARHGWVEVVPMITPDGLEWTDRPDGLSGEADDSETAAWAFEGNTGLPDDTIVELFWEYAILDPTITPPDTVPAMAEIWVIRGVTLPIQRMIVKSIALDTLTCHTLHGAEESDEDIVVAKPFILRSETSVTNYPGVTFGIFGGNGNIRTAFGVGDPEAQFMLPPWTVGEELIAVKVGEDRTGIPGVDWIDQTDNGRHWVADPPEP